MQNLKIPEERIGVLIGEKGRVKHEIEKRTNTSLTVSETEVTIEGDPVGEWIAKDIVLAIGRGFNPFKAYKLAKDDYTLELVELRGVVGDSSKAQKRLKGRIIGEGGKTRRIIEQLTDADISVYGKTVAIIGTFDHVGTAKDAVIKLLDGAPHASVYRFLERSRKGPRSIR